MDIDKYQNFVMWKAENPQTRQPKNISAYMQMHNLTAETIEQFMQHENYTQDLNRAVRFLMVNELPDLMLSLYEKVKSKQKGTDLESLYKLVLDPKVTKGQEEAGNVFGEFAQSIDAKQASQIAQRLSKKLGNG